MDEQTFNDQDLYNDASFNYSISQIFSDAQSENVDTQSTSLSLVWEYFDKEPFDAPVHNVCKTCSFKYKLTTGISTLRKHLKDNHQIVVPTRNTRKQTPITEVKPFNQQEQAEHTEYLIRWLICDLQPFTTVDNVYFREFIKHFCPQYTIPRRQQVKDLIMSAFINRRTKIASELQIEGQCSLTADIWTSINQDAYLGITIHYIDSNWNLRNFLLDIIPFTTRHTGENIANEIITILNEFNILDKVIALTTDNESAMVVCGRKLAESLGSQLSLVTFSHYRCAGHILNLGVKQGLELIGDPINKVHELMNKIKNSTLLYNQLCNFCELKNIYNYKPVLDVVTRWNSTYHMLKRLEELKPALVLLAADNDNIKSLYPNEDYWVAIRVNMNFLKKKTSI